MLLLSRLNHQIIRRSRPFSVLSPFQHALKTVGPPPSEFDSTLSNRILDNVERSWTWRMHEALGDEWIKPPQAARLMFIFTGVIFTGFCIACGTATTPFAYEVVMRYQLKCAGVVMSFWAGIGWAADMAKFGPRHAVLTVGSRYLMPLAMVGTSALGIILGDYDPWLSYKVNYQCYTIYDYFPLYIIS